MAIRETINKHPWITTAVMAVLVVVAVGSLLYRSQQGGSAAAQREFYTDDDGKTWFVDDASKLPPFNHNGRVAYRCIVYTTDGGKTKFISHLERYTEAAKKRIQEEAAKAAAGPMEGPTVSPADVEVKRPGSGDTGWVGLLTAEGLAISAPPMPKDPGQTLERATP